MFIDQSDAQAVFDSLPREFQYPTLNPSYVAIDCEDIESRVPLFWSTRVGDDTALISSEFGPAYAEFNDVESQRGYGGPTGTIPFDSELWKDIWAQYEQDVRKKDGLANFVRFTPLLGNQRAFNGDTFLDRHTVAIDLGQDTELLKNFESRARTAVRKAIKNSVTAKWADGLEDWQAFINLYNQRMDELNASSQYRFSNKYFDQMAAWSNARLLLCFQENELLAGSIFLTSPDYWDYHLSASNRTGMKLCATQWIIWNACVAAESEEVKALHLGGGTDNKEDNPLFFFKRGFSKKSTPFYFGKQILQIEEYEKLQRKFERDNYSTSRVLFYRQPVTRNENKMNAKPILNLLEEVLEEDFDTLDGLERLEDIGWDSLAFMGFITLLNERHSVKVAPQEIAGCETVNQLVELLVAKK